MGCQYGQGGLGVKKHPPGTAPRKTPHTTYSIYTQGAVPARKRSPAGIMSTEHLLTPFDQLMVLDEHSGYPMCFFIEADVEGPLDHPRLVAAVASAADRHPRIRSRIASRRGRLVWLPPDRLPEVEWFPCQPSNSGSATTPWRPIDLRREAGVRLVARAETPLAWRVTLIVHHAVCDGLAAVEFMGDIWSCYHGASPAPFRWSGQRGQPTATPEAAFAPQSLAREALSFATFFPQPIRPGPAADQHQPAVLSPPFTSVALSRDLTTSLRARAAAAGCTVNDVVVAAVMRGIVAWNAAAGWPSRGVRITMPCSLKPPGQRAPAVNDMSYAFLDRTAQQCQNAAGLVRSIGEASRWIQEHRAAEGFLHTLAAMVRVPRLLWTLTRLPICLSTAVVSNVGNVGTRMRANVPKVDGCDMPGPLRITALRGVPPLRPRTRLAVGLTHYNGQLHLTFLGDSAALGPLASQRLLGLVQAAILENAAALSLPPEEAGAFP